MFALGKTGGEEGDATERKVGDALREEDGRSAKHTALFITFTGGKKEKKKQARRARRGERFATGSQVSVRI